MPRNDRSLFAIVLFSAGLFLLGAPDLSWAEEGVEEELPLTFRAQAVNPNRQKIQQTRQNKID